MVTRDEAGEGISWDTGTDTYTLLSIKQMTDENLPHSTGNAPQQSVMIYMGTEPQKKSGYMSIYN